MVDCYDNSFLAGCLGCLECLGGGLVSGIWSNTLTCEIFNCEITQAKYAATFNGMANVGVSCPNRNWPSTSKEFWTDASIADSQGFQCWDFQAATPQNLKKKQKTKNSTQTPQNNTLHPDRRASLLLHNLFWVNNSLLCWGLVLKWGSMQLICLSMDNWPRLSIFEAINQMLRFCSFAQCLESSSATFGCLLMNDKVGLKAPACQT